MWLQGRGGEGVGGGVVGIICVSFNIYIPIMGGGGGDVCVVAIIYLLWLEFERT